LRLEKKRLRSHERGERRIDIVELREMYIAAGTTLERFVKCFERKLR
jgi:hypothetical protein